MPNRRDILKKGALGTALIGSAGIAGVGKVTAASRRMAGDSVKSSQGVGDCSREVLRETDSYSDVRINCSDEAVDARVYHESGKVEIISKFDTMKSDDSSAVQSQVELPDPPTLIHSINERIEIVDTHCSVPMIDNHYFVGIDLKLSSDGTDLSNTVVAGIACAAVSFYAIKHPVAAMAFGGACAAGAWFGNYIMTDGYDIRTNVTMGLIDVDEGNWILLPGGSTYVENPAVALVAAPNFGAPTDKLDYQDIFYDLENISSEISGIDNDTVGHLEPLVKNI